MFRFENNVLKRIWGFKFSNCVFQNSIDQSLRSVLFGVQLFKFEIQHVRFPFWDFHCWLSAAPSSPAFVLYRVAAFRIVLGSLRFSLFYVVSFRVVPRSFQLRCATVFLFWFSNSKTHVGFQVSICVFCFSNFSFFSEVIQER